MSNGKDQVRGYKDTWAWNEVALLPCIVSAVNHSSSSSRLSLVVDVFEVLSTVNDGTVSVLRFFWSFFLVL